MGDEQADGTATTGHDEEARIAQLVAEQVTAEINKLTGGKPIQEMLGMVAQAAAKIAKEEVKSEVDSAVAQGQERLVETAAAQQGQNGAAPAETPPTAAPAPAAKSSPAISVDGILSAAAANPMAAVDVIFDKAVQLINLFQSRRDDLNVLDEISARRPHIFGLYAPNPWGNEQLKMQADSFKMGQNSIRAGLRGGAPDGHNPFPSSEEPSESSDERKPRGSESSDERPSPPSHSEPAVPTAPMQVIGRRFTEIRP